MGLAGRGGQPHPQRHLRRDVRGGAGRTRSVASSIEEVLDAATSVVPAASRLAGAIALGRELAASDVEPTTAYAAAGGGVRQPALGAHAEQRRPADLRAGGRARRLRPDDLPDRDGRLGHRLLRGHRGSRGGGTAGTAVIATALVRAPAEPAEHLHPGLDGALSFDASRSGRWPCPTTPGGGARESATHRGRGRRRRAGVSIASVLPGAERHLGPAGDRGTGAGGRRGARLRPRRDRTPAQARSRRYRSPLPWTPLDNPVYAEMMRGVEAGLGGSGRGCWCPRPGTTRPTSLALVDSLSRGYADGLIISPLRRTPELTAALVGAPVPVVVIGELGNAPAGQRAHRLPAGGSPGVRASAGGPIDGGSPSSTGRPTRRRAGPGSRVSAACLGDGHAGPVVEVDDFTVAAGEHAWGLGCGRLGPLVRTRCWRPTTCWPSG